MFTVSPPERQKSAWLYLKYDNGATLESVDPVPAQIQDLQVGVESQVCLIDLLNVIIGEI